MVIFETLASARPGPSMLGGGETPVVRHQAVGALENLIRCRARKGRPRAGGPPHRPFRSSCSSPYLACFPMQRDAALPGYAFTKEQGAVPAPPGGTDNAAAV